MAKINDLFKETVVGKFIFIARGWYVAGSDIVLLSGIKSN